MNLPPEIGLILEASRRGVKVRTRDESTV